MSGCIAFAEVANGQNPPQEPQSYRTEPYLARVPATLRGARVVSTAEAYEIWSTKNATLVDAMPRPPKPNNLPAGTIWRDTPRFNIPGSIWLVDTGYGNLSIDRDRYFKEHLDRVTGGVKSAPLLFYCKMDCWMSWNAAKRAIEEYGYTNVMWFPDGTDGWKAAGFDLREAQPEP